MRRDNAGASGGRNGLHAATVLDTQHATGFIRTGGVNERLRVRMFLVAVRDGDHGILGWVGRGRSGVREGDLIEHEGKGRGGDGC